MKKFTLAALAATLIGSIGQASGVVVYGEYQCPSSQDLLNSYKDWVYTVSNPGFPNLSSNYNENSEDGSTAGNTLNTLYNAIESANASANHVMSYCSAAAPRTPSYCCKTYSECLVLYHFITYQYYMYSLWFLNYFKNYKGSNINNLTAIINYWQQEVNGQISYLNSPLADSLQQPTIIQILDACANPSSVVIPVTPVEPVKPTPVTPVQPVKPTPVTPAQPVIPSNAISAATSATPTVAQNFSAVIQSISNLNHASDFSGTVSSMKKNALMISMLAASNPPTASQAASIYLSAIAVPGINHSNSNNIDDLIWNANMLSNVINQNLYNSYYTPTNGQVGTMQSILDGCGQVSAGLLQYKYMLGLTTVVPS